MQVTRKRLFFAEKEYQLLKTWLTVQIRKTAPFLWLQAIDMFQDTYSVSKSDIKALLDTLSRFNGTVIVLPGNHDYYNADVKVWMYFKDVMQRL